MDEQPDPLSSPMPRLVARLGIVCAELLMTQRALLKFLGDRGILHHADFVAFLDAYQIAHEHEVREWMIERLKMDEQLN